MANNILLPKNSYLAKAYAASVQTINWTIKIDDTIKKVFRKYLAKGACSQASAKFLKVYGARISKLTAYSLV